MNLVTCYFSDLNIDEELINKSISLSSFNIKECQKITPKYGNAPKDGSFIETLHDQVLMAIYR